MPGGAQGVTAAQGSRSAATSSPGRATLPRAGQGSHAGTKDAKPTSSEVLSDCFFLNLQFKHLQTFFYPAH